MDARRFAAAYARLVLRKYAGARGGVAGEGHWRWVESGDALDVERQGSEVLVMEGVPRGRAERLRAWVWRVQAGQR